MRTLDAAVVYLALAVSSSVICLGIGLLLAQAVS